MTLVATAVEQDKPAVSAEIGRLIGEAAKLVEGSKAASTLKSYQHDVDVYQRFALEHGLGVGLPLEVEAVAAFVAWSVEQGVKGSTLGRRMAALAHVHAAAGLASPTAHPAIRQAIAGAKRSVGMAVPVKRSAAIDGDVVKQLIAVEGGPSLLALRNRALLLCSFFTAARVSEVLALNVEDLDWVDGLGYQALIRKSKKDQVGVGRTALLPMQENPALDPCLALNAWIEAASINSGSLFRGISPSGRSVLVGRLTRRSCLNVIKGWCTAAGLDATSFSFHGIRSGAATTMALQGIPVTGIAEAGGWAVNSSALGGYIRAGANRWNLNGMAQIKL